MKLKHTCTLLQKVEEAIGSKHSKNWLVSAAEISNTVGIRCGNIACFRCGNMAGTFPLRKHGTFVHFRCGNVAGTFPLQKQAMFS